MDGSGHGCTLWSAFFFIKFVNGLTERYPEIYEGRGVTSEHQVNFSKKWKGYSSLIELAEGDVTRIDAITSEPLEKCLLLLAYKADKSELESMLHREAMKRLG